MSTFFEATRPTYIENWPAALCRLSVAQEDVPLTPAEARDLGLNIVELGGGFVPLTPAQAEQKARAMESARARTRVLMLGKPTDGPGSPEEVPFPKVDWVMPDLSVLRGRVALAVARFPQGAFVRLGSRSPKDAFSWGGAEPGKVLVGQDPLRLLLDCSERVYEDLQLALAHDYAPHVWVRQWLDIPDWAELRCFVRGRRLVGVSQYLPDVHFPELHAERDMICWGVKQFYEQLFRPACHLDDVVCDVFVKVRVRGNEGNVEVCLLEINPMGPLTDPCLFDYRGGGDFDGSFRHVGPGRVVQTMRIR